MRDRIVLTGFLIVALLFVFLFVGLGLNADNYEYFLSRRTPKVMAIVIASIAIAQSSLVFQTITHNRILTPSIMGFDSLYVLIQVCILVVLGGVGSVLLSSFVKFSISVAVTVGFSLALFSFYFRRENPNIMTLLLTGVIFGQLFSNIAGFFMMVMDPTEFSFLQGAMFASFNNVNSDLVYLCLIPLSIVIGCLYSLHNKLDVFWLDKDNALSLGVDVSKVTKQVLVLVSILIAVSTALVGPILFFGLLVANLTRQCFKTYRHKILMTGASLMGVCMLLSGQWVIERVFEFETTLSVIVNFVGGLYFLSLLIRQKV
ncbi:iron chelate uptake ABC transporter family permease subunit [Vibrio penaeicida]|uniref:ABC transporter permease n=1 Tax=Vibrio penaeicida TaxID=104609 RepID=A0AAV5NN87_9VIBR|nr:iron chelate uptake ABC transporter family permease subunit [Vibrio penaeicida]RTZ21091.1 ABC transporter permease [Vibrio penaeicida]GLQ72115.1 ABC transporter permease [Vibrio penaeicida]